MKKIIYFLSLVSGITAAMFACAPKDPVVEHATINKTVMQVLREDARFTTLVQAITRISNDPNLGFNAVAVLDAPLNPSAAEASLGDSITLLAPVNQAFTDAGIDVATIDINTLVQVLSYHVPLVGRNLAIGVPAPGGITRNILQNGQMPTLAAPNNEPYLRVRNAPSQAETFPSTVPANNSNRIFINRAASGAINSINGYARVTIPNIVASNGIVHGIDRVLLPPSQTLYGLISSVPNYSRFKYAVDRISGLATTLNTVSNTRTILIPNDAAFDAAGITTTFIDNNLATVTNVINYHINPSRAFSTNISSGVFTTTGYGVIVALSGNDAILNLNSGSRIIGLTSRGSRVDRVAINGVLHEINAVLTPIPTATQTVEQIAAGNSNLSLLVSALNATGLTLTGGSIGTVVPPSTPNAPSPFTGPYTVFAPTNEAFIAAGYDATRIATIAGAPANDPEKIRLTNILRYHVLPNRIFSLTATNGNQNTLLWNGTPFLAAGGGAPNGIPNQTNSPLVFNYRQVQISVAGGVFTVRGLANPSAVQINASLRNILGSNGVVHVVPNVLLF